MKVTGSNPVCASIINKLTYKHIWNNQITEEKLILQKKMQLSLREGQFATKQNPTSKPLSKWRRILNILFE